MEASGFTGSVRPVFRLVFGAFAGGPAGGFAGRGCRLFTGCLGGGCVFMAWVFRASRPLLPVFPVRLPFPPPPALGARY